MITTRKTTVCLAVVALMVIALAVTPAAAKGPPAGGGGGHTEVVGNNLSFPAIALDGFAITPLNEPTFSVPYDGDYPGLTAEEIAMLGEDDWYPQKTTGNLWQADFVNRGTEDVTYIDWGDNIESVSPKVRSPFRLEMTLYKFLENAMTGYTMAVLEYPSSSNELQGTNKTTYSSSYATVISSKPKLVVQYLGTTVPTDMTWTGTQWSLGTPVQVSFAPELNVGGKYVFGASQGGWKPTQAGYYRITFYVPTSSGVNLALGTIANASTGFNPPTEARATAVLVRESNLTYVDVLATTSGGGGRR